MTSFHTVTIAIILVMCCCFSNAQRERTRGGRPLDLTRVSPLEGVWQLNRTRDSGDALDSLLAAAGVEYFKRQVVVGLEMTDRYWVSYQQFRIARHTVRGDTDHRYRIDTQEDIQDPVLGAVRSVVRVNDDMSRVMMTMTRAHDSSVFVGMRHVAVRTDARLMIYTMNFTTGAGQRLSCVRYFVKQH